MLGPVSHSAHAAENVEISQAHLEPTDDGYRLSSSYSFELNRLLEEAITGGFALYFTTDVEITRRRWYWFDEKAQVKAQTIKISYDLLTRRYSALIYNPASTASTVRLRQTFDTLDDALSLVRRPSRWLVAEKGVLKPGETYLVGVRMGLDLSQLPKPLQIHAINNSDWRMSSNWKYFTFKAD